MLNTRFAIFIAAAVLFGNQAMAADLIATKPGVMCTSADALAQLTLPGGESRTHGETVTPEMQALAQSGGCVDIQPGITVSVQTAHKNTSVISYRRPNSDINETFVIPNIDFTPVFTDDEDKPEAAAPTESQVVPPAAGLPGK